MNELREATDAANDGSREDVTKPLAGFGLTALGGLLLGLGAMLPWIRSSLAGLPDELSPTYLGMDLPDGLVVLAAAVVIVGGVATTRLAGSPDAKRIGASAIVAASLLALTVAAVASVTATGRFEPDVVADTIELIDPSGAVSVEQRAQVEELVETRLGSGPWVAIAGALLGIAGGLLVLSWAVARDPNAPADEAGAAATEVEAVGPGER